MRCRSLAYYVQGQFKDIHFILSNTLEVAKTYLVDFSVIELKSESAEELLKLKIGSSDVLIIDGYQFDFNFLKKLRQGNFCQLVINDIPNEPIPADFLINYNPATDLSSLNRFIEPGTVVLSGLPYLLVNPIFKPFKRAQTEPNVLLVMFGGSDPENFTLESLKEINLKKFKKINVVIGGGYQFEGELKDWVDELEQDIVIHKSVPPEAVKLIMEESGTALLSASTSAFEYGIISGDLILRKTAHNQELVYKYFIENRLAIEYESWVSENPTIEFAEYGMTSRQWQVFQNASSGYHNLATKLLGYSELKVRKASEDDVKLYFDWANDPDTRLNSINTSEIHWEDHLEWFSGKLNNSDSVMYVCMHNGLPVGQVRFERAEGTTYSINYSVAPDSRGKGYSTILLARTIRRLLSEYEVSKLTAIVKSANQPSLKAFRSLVFNEVSGQEIVKFDFEVNVTC